MADIPGNIDPLNDLEIGANKPITTALMTKIAANINALIAGRNVTVFTSNGNYTVPEQTTELLLIGCGGGGGGSAGVTTVDSKEIAGGGGASGAYGVLRVSVTPNSVHAVTIGAGGLGATTENSPGGNGGNTTFGSIATFLGGNGGQTVPELKVLFNGTIPASVTTGFKGGRGGPFSAQGGTGGVWNGDYLLLDGENGENSLNFPGGQGAQSTNTNDIGGGGGGASPFGAGGDGASPSANINAPALPSTSYGAGGGGGGKKQQFGTPPRFGTGANGVSGILIIVPIN